MNTSKKVIYSLQESEAVEIATKDSDDDNDDDTEVDNLKTKEEALDFLINDEKEAIDGYKDVLSKLNEYDMTEDLKDLYTKKMNEIIGDEEDHIKILEGLKDGKDVSDSKDKKSDEIYESTTPNIEKFIYDLDKDKGNAWSVNYNGVKNGVEVLRNGNSENTVEDIEKAVTTRFPQLKTKLIANNKNGIIFTYTK